MRVIIVTTATLTPTVCTLVPPLCVSLAVMYSLSPLAPSHAACCILWLYLGQALLRSTHLGCARTSAASSAARPSAPSIAGTLYCGIVHGIMLHIVPYITSYIISNMTSIISITSSLISRHLWPPPWPQAQSALSPPGGHPSAAITRPPSVVMRVAPSPSASASFVCICCVYILSSFARYRTFRAF